MWLTASDPNGDFLQLSILYPGPTLLGYAGGPLVPTTFLGDGTYFELRGGEGNGDLNFGSLTPEITTPEPTCVTLLASGFFAAGGFHFFRRRRKSSPAC